MVKLDRIEHFVTIPEDVTATLSEDGVVSITGPKGTLSRTFVSTSCKVEKTEIATESCETKLTKKAGMKRDATWDHHGQKFADLASHGDAS